uniref:Vacuolar ATPase assembly protein VMA22 n=1 Tax=Clastoptera arizonana TaxID=38151 RepID=A0A1B6CZ24_9HEMI
MAESDNGSINEELDNLAVRILELMNEHIECKMNIERLVRTGCLDLAKSRYIMGNNSVSALQFPTDDVTPLTSIETSTNDGKTTFHLNKTIPDVKKLSSEEDQVLDKNKEKDPLKWFGVLVPQNLRQSKTWFEKALDISVQCANVTSEINSYENKYSDLLKKKTLLKST